VFQVHLWAGVALAAYVVLISVTGAALVFREEMERAGLPRLSGAPLADFVTVAERMRAAHPDRRLASLGAPGGTSGVFLGFLEKNGEYLPVAADAHTGELLSAPRSTASFLRWLQQLHFNLLAGRAGRVANGIGALATLALGVTGLVVWWPGIRHWRRGLGIDFRRNWRRITFDVHAAAGFWTLGFLLLWTTTGAYFAWPAQFRAAVNRVSRLTLAEVPVPDASQKGRHPAPDLRRMIAEAQARTPGGRLLSVTFSLEDDRATRVYIARQLPMDYETSDTHYFDPFTGRHLGVFQRGIARSLGDLVMTWIAPLHFGTFGGLPVKAVWTVFGLSPAVLAVTGILMYWNRYLSRRWARPA
jgi:uncharacterized iron-regulated membrane protein